jgi:hypothetical protein
MIKINFTIAWGERTRGGKKASLGGHGRFGGEETHGGGEDKAAWIFWWVVGFDGTHNFDMYGGAMATWRENV